MNELMNGFGIISVQKKRKTETFSHTMYNIFVKVLIVPINWGMCNLCNLLHSITNL